MNLVLPYPPSANRYWRVYKGRAIKSEEARIYQKAVGLQCMALGLSPFTGPVRVTMTVYRPIRRGDLDNSEKLVLDSLNGHAYNDDSQIVEIHAYRRDDKAHPRVEVNIVSVAG